MIHRKYFLHCCRCFIIVLAALAQNTNATSNTTPCQVDSFKIIATKIDAKNLDSALHHLEQIFNEISPQLDTACLIQFYRIYAIEYGISLNFSLSVMRFLYSLEK